MRRALPWLVVVGLWAGLAGFTAAGSVARYDRLASGWSWDLAYYNQWSWALTRGDGQITVRPIGPFTQEGPSIGSMNYLTPARLAIAPLYAYWPGPRTLLVVNALVLWLVVPAVYGLVRDEAQSVAIGLSAALLVPLTPLLWPLALNDFRELQLAPPFIVWAVHGVRVRRIGLSALGIGGLLACRQEFALMAASLAFLPPARPERLARRTRWARSLWLVGLGWFVFGFLGYMCWCVNYRALEMLGGSAGSSAPLAWRLRTGWGLLVFGTGAWSLLALPRPRVALLALPWLWGVTSGLFEVDQVATVHWHHVRYAAPLIGMLLAAGGVGYAWLARTCFDGTKWPRLVAVWLLLALANWAATGRLLDRFAAGPTPIPAAEVEPLRRWIDAVGPDDGVIARYELCAPLSSRRRLYSYVMDQNKPPNYPELDRGIAWLFLDRKVPRAVFERQGFTLCYEGPSTTVLRRDAAAIVTQAPRPWPHGGTLALMRRGVFTSAFDSVDQFAGTLAFQFGQVILTLMALVPWFLVRRWKQRHEAATAVIPAGITGLAAATAWGDAMAADRVSIEVADEGHDSGFDPATATLPLAGPVAHSEEPADVARAIVAVVHAAEASRHDVRAVVRDATRIAVVLGRSTGVLLLAAGVWLLSWDMAQLGALVLSATSVGALVVARWLERSTAGRAREGLERAGVPGPEARKAVVDAIVVWCRTGAVVGGKS